MQQFHNKHRQLRRYVSISALFLTTEIWYFLFCLVHVCLKQYNLRGDGAAISWFGSFCKRQMCVRVRERLCLRSACLCDYVSLYVCVREQPQPADCLRRTMSSADKWIWLESRIEYKTHYDGRSFIMTIYDKRFLYTYLQIQTDNGVARICSIHCAHTHTHSHNHISHSAIWYQMECDLSFASPTNFFISVPFWLLQKKSRVVVWMRKSNLFPLVHNGNCECIGSGEIDTQMRQLNPVMFTAQHQYLEEIYGFEKKREKNGKHTFRI